MSNTDRRLPLAVAKQIANGLVELLRPSCERIEIAGSIRRMKDDIGDVEIVCIPRMSAAPAGMDLFGDVQNVVPVSLLDEACGGLLADGTLQPRLNKNGGKSWGSDLKWGVFQDFAVDIYSATAETWGVVLAIRTGSADFSHKLVTPRRQGGFCPDYLTFKGTKEGGSWRVRRRDDGMPYATPEERDVFHALGIEYLEPPLRTDHALPRQRCVFRTESPVAAEQV